MSLDRNDTLHKIQTPTSNERQNSSDRLGRPWCISVSDSQTKNQSSSLFDRWQRTMSHRLWIPSLRSCLRHQRFVSWVESRSGNHSTLLGGASSGNDGGLVNGGLVNGGSCLRSSFSGEKDVRCLAACGKRTPVALVAALKHVPWNIVACDIETDDRDFN
jgi:hypothetical protein